MSEQSTTSDLVDRWRRSFQAIGSGDMDGALRIADPDGLWDLSPMGLGVYEGLAATRGFFEDWLDTYDDFQIEVEEMLDLGNGIGFAVIRQGGRLKGSTGHVHLRYAAVSRWVDGLAVRITNYPDIDEARAAAERLAPER